MSFNNIIPSWVISAGLVQESYRVGNLSYTEAVYELDKIKAPKGCYEVLDNISKETLND